MTGEEYTFVGEGAMMVNFLQSSVRGGFGLTTLVAGRCAHNVRFDGQRRWNRSWDAKCECFLLHLAFCIPSSTQVVKIQASLLTMLMLVCFLRADAPQLMAMGIANVLADGMSMGFGGEKYFLCAFLTDACISLWRRAPMHACSDTMLAGMMLACVPKVVELLQLVSTTVAVRPHPPPLRNRQCLTVFVRG